MNVFARQEWLIQDFSVGVGARLFPTFNEFVSCVEGRPLRNASGEARVAEAGQRVARSNRRCEPDLGREWAESMQEEHESVFAFLQLAVELETAHAPGALVERALVAAQDEILHAWLCGQLARR